MSHSTLQKIARAPIRWAKKAYSLLSIHTSSWFLGLTASWGDTNYERLAEEGMKNPYSKRAYDLTHSNMSSVPLVAQKAVMVDGTEEMEEEADHDFLELLRRPNQETGYQTFVQKIIAHLYFGGEVFFYAPESPLTGQNAGKPGEAGLHLIRPDYVKEIKRNKDTREREFYYVEWPDGTPKDIPAARVWHAKLYNPTNEERGYPLLLAAWRAVMLMKESDEWNKSVAENKGRIPGFFKYTGEGDFTDDQFKRTKESMQEAYMDDAKNSRPGLLQGDYDFMPASTNQKDADWLDAISMAMRQIVVALGFDPALFGDEANRTLSNLEIALKLALQLTILPLLDWILDELNTKYMPMYGEAVLAYNRDQIEALQEDQNQKYARFGRAVSDGVVSRNEARGELGWDPDENPKSDALQIAFGQEFIGIEEEDESLELMSEIDLILKDLTNGHKQAA